MIQVIQVEKLSCIGVDIKQSSNYAFLFFIVIVMLFSVGTFYSRLLLSR